MYSLYSHDTQACHLSQLVWSQPVPVLVVTAVVTGIVIVVVTEAVAVLVTVAVKVVVTVVVAVVVTVAVTEAVTLYSRSLHIGVSVG